MKIGFGEEIKCYTAVGESFLKALKHITCFKMNCKDDSMTFVSGTSNSHQRQKHNEENIFDLIDLISYCWKQACGLL